MLLLLVGGPVCSWRKTTEHSARTIFVIYKDANTVNAHVYVTVHTRYRYPTDAYIA